MYLNLIPCAVTLAHSALAAKLPSHVAVKRQDYSAIPEVSAVTGGQGAGVLDLSGLGLGGVQGLAIPGIGGGQGTGLPDLSGLGLGGGPGLAIPGIGDGSGAGIPDLSGLGLPSPLGGAQNPNPSGLSSTSSGIDKGTPNYFQYRRQTSNTGTCTDVHFVFARGTTEAQGFGIAGGPLNNAFKSAFKSYSSYAVVYPAAFDQNSASGSLAAANNMAAVISACPQTKIILGGYSQGASLVHGIRTTDTVKKAVKAILLFGDPYLNFAQPSTSNLPISDNVGIFDACNVADIVCNRPNSLGKGTTHLGYVPGTTNAAAEFAKSKIAAS